MFVPIKAMYSWVSNHSNGILSHKTLQGLLCESSKAVVYMFIMSLTCFPFYLLLYKDYFLRN